MAEKQKRVEALAKRLKSVRARAGLTQDQLADASGVGVATIRRIEGSVSETKIDTLARLAETLKVDMKWLAFGGHREEMEQ